LLHEKIIFPDLFYSISLHDTPSADKCIPFPRNNRTIITDVYAGIPENLLLNVIGFLVKFYLIHNYSKYIYRNDDVIIENI